VLHTTPYSESSLVVKVFTRQLGLRSYIIKGVRGRGGRVKQNMFQPLSNLDMVVYNNEKTDLNYIKEISPRNISACQRVNVSIENALRFFMTEVLYKALREAEPVPALFDYVDAINSQSPNTSPHLPISFLLTVARHLGIEPLDNYCSRDPYFCLEEGRFVSAANATTLPQNLSSMLHVYLCTSLPTSHFPLEERTALIDTLISYFHLHLSGFSNFHSHEILHALLK